MSTAERISQPLLSGEKLSREEFLRRWEALPHVKFAGLLEGEVYVPSPLLLAHGSQDSAAGFWLAYYGGFTPGCESANQVTWLMLQDAPQPRPGPEASPLSPGGCPGVHQRAGRGVSGDLAALG